MESKKVDRIALWVLKAGGWYVLVMGAAAMFISFAAPEHEALHTLFKLDTSALYMRSIGAILIVVGIASLIFAAHVPAMLIRQRATQKTANHYK